ncbi:Npt1/Npt2 family nucleotide transporter [Cohnella sp. GCM10027633]|uniref:Npt1/Npt2 family nucleotide transporter n=1 Tax=unclassified Cohnella TaxID=2636738 RepID=UPI00363B8E43
MKKDGGKTWRSMLGGFGEGGTDGARVRWLFAYLFCVVSASTVGRTAADTLFLSRFDASWLSKMYLPQAASLILVGFLFQKYGSRFRLDRLLLLLIPVISGGVVLSRMGVGLDLQWVYPVIYVGFDVFNFLMIVCFWQFASSVLDQRKAKRTIPIVGSGGIVGGILSGFGLKLLAPLIGTSNLLFAYAALQLLALTAVLFINRTIASPAETFGGSPSGAKDNKQAKRAAQEPGGGLFASVPHLKYVAILSAALVLSLTFIDYQFKVILRSEMEGDALAGFMGSFYGFSGLCALLVQLFVAGKLLSRFGVMLSILVFPIALLAGSVGLLFVPVLALALVVKGSDKVLGDTINSSVNQLIMFPISPEWRNRAKSFLDGVVRNGAKGVAAISLIVLSPLLSVREFSFIVIALVAVGIYAAIRVKGAYLRMLLSTLEARGADLPDSELDLMDPASRGLLAGALRSPDRQQSLYALRTLAKLESFDLAPYLPELVRHPASEVAEEALRYIERKTPAGMEPELLRLLSEPAEANVKSQALIALAAYAQDANLDTLTERLDADEVAVRAGAIAGLIKYYGIEGMFRAVGTLKTLIESWKDNERTAMASLFGRIGVREFYKPLIPMLQDASSEVRRCALESAGQLAVPELVPHIVPLLRESRTRRQAIEALTAYEDKVVLPLLDPYLVGESASPHVPAAIARIGTQSAFAMLLKHYGEASFDMRDRLLDAMSGMHREQLQVDAAEVERLALLELVHYGSFADNLDWKPRRASDSELREAAEQARDSMMRRAFGLLGLVHDAHTIDAVYLGWSEGDARRQANAAEVMDQLLQGDLRTELTKWMLAPRSATGESEKTVKKEQLIWLYDHGDEMLREAIRFSAIGTEADHSGRRGLPFVDEAEGDALRERMTRLQMLRKSTLFEGFKGKDLLPLVDFLQTIDVTAGQGVFNEGDPGDALFLVREGKAGIYKGDELLDERGPGDHIGETAVLTRRVRTATVRAVTDARLLRLSSADFYEALFDRTELSIEMMKRLSRKLRTAMMERQRHATAEATAATAEAAAASEAAEAPAEQRGESVSAPAADAPVPAPVPASAPAPAPASAPASAADPNAEITNQVILRRVLVLQKIELFAHLSQDDFVRLANQVEEVVYAPGEAICRMDEHGDSMFGIIEGSIQVHRGPEKLATLGVGQYFGEMAIIDSGPRSADCTAVERAVLLKLGRQHVYAICFQQIDALKGMMKVLADRLRELG